MPNTMTSALDRLTAIHTAFDTFAALTATGYTPTLSRRTAGSLGAALEARGRKVFWRD